MTDTTHTPGPWQVSGTSRTRGCSLQVEAEMQTPVAYIQGPDGGESLANASLIAAAPEMLEALKAMFDVMTVSGKHSYRPDSETGRAIEVTRAAIAKAEGRDGTTVTDAGDRSHAATCASRYSFGECTCGIADEDEGRE